MKNAQVCIGAVAPTLNGTRRPSPRRQKGDGHTIFAAFNSAMTSARASIREDFRHISHSISAVPFDESLYGSRKIHSVPNLPSVACE
jgi:hypothetical protein